MKIAAIVNKKGREFATVRESAPLSEAVDLMYRRSIGSVGIAGRTSSEILGIVSQQEVTKAIAERGIHALQLPAVVFMRKRTLYCCCEDNASQVMGMMTRERSRHAVVLTAAESLAGVVSLGDLVAALLEQAQLEAGVLRDMARSHLVALPG